MILGIIADGHYFKDENGIVYVEYIYSYCFWKRYLSEFEKVIVFARGSSVRYDDRFSTWERANGENVQFIMVPDFSGLNGFLVNYLKIQKILSEGLKIVDRLLIRYPSIISNTAYSLCKKNRKSYSIELVADPFENYRLLSSWYAFPLSIYMKHMCRLVCYNAKGVSYVTKNHLQIKYPSRYHIDGDSTHFCGNYSSIVLQNSFFSAPRELSFNRHVKLLHVSLNIEGNGKGHYECIKILNNLISYGNKNITFTFIGWGNEVRKLQELAIELGIDKNVVFLGRISNHNELRDIIKEHDFFVFPSKTEGLPRCIIEAMACSLVCVASNVGGIPELLQSENLFCPNDVEGFSHQLQLIITNSEKYRKYSLENYQRALEFSDYEQMNQRNQFFKNITNLG